MLPLFAAAEVNDGQQQRAGGPSGRRASADLQPWLRPRDALSAARRQLQAVGFSRS
jgi:hypothetical protein